MTLTDLWRKLESGGRLKRQTFCIYAQPDYAPTENDYFTLRLTEEERERLLYPQFQTHANLEILGQ